ncbi:hypothetical protein [Bradyrhizobium sp. URHD0069]|uniref:hypothetical protein n=1 Tax=Bradyrhizobium sp. URHD0069 TaxID=1380355 RepID=UPI0009DF37AA|nr:hypothetical protein [Bradyrhizobium sp. URHD0069]
MPQFRKKPVVIEAVKWNGYSNNIGLTNGLEPMNGERYESPAWMPPVSFVVTDQKYPSHPGPGEIWRDGESLWIGTLEGNMVASPGDWIIQGVKGELYPCKPDIFAATYEPVSGLAVVEYLGADALR